MVPLSVHFLVFMFWILIRWPTWKSSVASSGTDLLSAVACLEAAASRRSVGWLASALGIGRAVLGLLARNICAGEKPSALGVALHSRRLSVNSFQEEDLASSVLHAATACSARPALSWW